MKKKRINKIEINGLLGVVVKRLSKKMMGEV